MAEFCEEELVGPDDEGGGVDDKGGEESGAEEKDEDGGTDELEDDKKLLEEDLPELADDAAPAAVIGIPSVPTRKVAKRAYASGEWSLGLGLFFVLNAVVASFPQ